jgi:hypothetical protein
MSRRSPVDRAFYGAVGVLLLILGVYLVVDSVKNQGYRLGSSFRVLMLVSGMILSLLATLRRRGHQGAIDETQTEE